MADRDLLRAVAVAAGVKVDGRWSEATLRSEIASACGIVEPEATDEPEAGRVYEAVERAVAALRDDPGLDDVGEARATIALRLALTLDQGAGLIEASIARELSAVLDQLAPGDERDGDKEILEALGDHYGSPG